MTLSTAETELMESGGWWMECQLERRSRSPGKRSLQEGQKSSLVSQSAISILTTEPVGIGERDI